MLIQNGVLIRHLDVAICLQSIKSGEFLRIFSKHLSRAACLLAVEPSVFVKQPIKGWNHSYCSAYSLYPKNKLKTKCAIQPLLLTKGFLRQSLDWTGLDWTGMN